MLMIMAYIMMVIILILCGVEICFMIEDAHEEFDQMIETELERCDGRVDD